MQGDIPGGNFHEIEVLAPALECVRRHLDFPGQNGDFLSLSQGLSSQGPRIFPLSL